MALIDLVVVLGAAVVVPAALRSWTPAWVAVGAATALAVSLPPGPGALVASVPWLAAALAATARAATGLARRRRPRPGPIGGAEGADALDRLAAVAAPGFAVVAGVALVVSCGGLGLFPVGEPIVRLTVVHFTFAGTATTVLALGFVTGSALAQVGGAALMTGAAYAVAASHLSEGWPARATTVGRLLLVSGLSVWVPMALAVAWALAQHTGGPALSVPDMARAHGSLNAFGFVGCGLAARWLADHVVTPVPVVDAPAPAVPR